LELYDEIKKSMKLRGKRGRGRMFLSGSKRKGRRHDESGKKIKELVIHIRVSKDERVKKYTLY